MDELKNWFDEAFFRELAEHFHQQYSKFDRKAFVISAMDGLDMLSLMQRLRRTTELVAQQLPSDFDRALEILAPVAPVYQGTFKGMFFPDFVGVYGRDHFDRSLDALKYFTRYSSSEFAIREFLRLDLERTLDVMTDWAGDEDHHVRRLASEGSRPRLPWSFQIRPLIEDPAPVKPVLDALSADPELYVRKSVANHLNDISKDHPELMLDWVNAWDQGVEETAWITKHASRSLLKQGHPRAFALFGFEASPDVSVSDFSLTPPVLSLGEALSFNFSITSNKKTAQKLAIDYIVHYVKKSGKTTTKVFKLRELVLPAGAKQEIKKSQTFADFTTRKHYSGDHRIEIVINGTPVASGSFNLKV